MNTKLVLAAIGVAALAIGGGVYYHYFAFDEAAVARQAWEGDGSLHCTEQEGGQNQSGIAIRDGDIRIKSVRAAENDQTQGNQMVSTYLLDVDGVVYNWTEGQDQGIRSSGEDGPLEGGIKAMTDVDNLTQDIEKNDYSCSRNVDDAVLQPPEDVEFSLLNEQPGAPGTETQSSGQSAPPQTPQE